MKLQTKILESAHAGYWWPGVPNLSLEFSGDDDFGGVAWYAELDFINQSTGVSGLKLTSDAVLTISGSDTPDIDGNLGEVERINDKRSWSSNGTTFVSIAESDDGTYVWYDSDASKWKIIHIAESKAYGWSCADTTDRPDECATWTADDLETGTIVVTLAHDGMEIIGDWDFTVSERDALELDAGHWEAVFVVTDSLGRRLPWGKLCVEVE